MKRNYSSLKYYIVLSLIILFLLTPIISAILIVYGSVLLSLKSNIKNEKKKGNITLWTGIGLLAIFILVNLLIYNSKS